LKTLLNFGYNGNIEEIISGAKRDLIKRFDRIDGQALHLYSVAGLIHTNFNLP